MRYLMLMLFFSTVASANTTFEKDYVCVDSSIIAVENFRNKSKGLKKMYTKSDDMLVAAYYKIAADFGYHKATSTFDAFSTIAKACNDDFILKGVKK